MSDALKPLGTTPGPWEPGSIDNEGMYGDGPDARSGFKSYAVYDEKDRVLFDSYNSETSEIEVEYDDFGAHVWDENARRNLTLAAASPDLELALSHLWQEIESGHAKVRTATMLMVREALIKAGHVELQIKRETVRHINSIGDVR